MISMEKKLALLAVLALLPCLALAQETGKVVVVHLAISDSGITETNATVVYGLPPNCVTGEGDYTYSARASGVVISECGFYDPRVSMGDELTTEGNRSGIIEVAPEADAVLIFPFNPAMLTLDITNSSTNQTIFHADLAPLARDFCQSHPADPDCAGLAPATPTPAATATPAATPQPQDYTLIYAIVIGGIVLLAIAAVILAVLFLRKK